METTAPEGVTYGFSFVFPDDKRPEWEWKEGDVLERRLGIELDIVFSPTAKPDASGVANHFTPIFCQIIHSFSKGGQIQPVVFYIEFQPSRSQITNYQPTTRSPQTIEASSYLTRNQYYDSQPKPILTYVNHHSIMIHNLSGIKFFPPPTEPKLDGLQGIAAITITPTTPWDVEYNGEAPMDGSPATCILNGKEVLQGTFRKYSAELSTRIMSETPSLASNRVTFSNNDDDIPVIRVTPLEPLQILIYIPPPLQVILFQEGSSISIFCPGLHFSAYSPSYQEDMPEAWKDKGHGLEYKNAMRSTQIRTQVRFYQHEPQPLQPDGNRSPSLRLQNSIIAESLPTLSPFFPQTIISNSTWAVRHDVHDSYLQHSILSSMTFHFGRGFYHILNDNNKDEEDSAGHDLFGFLDSLSLVLTVSNCELDPNKFSNQPPGTSSPVTPITDKSTRFLYYYTYFRADHGDVPYATPMEFSSSTGAAIYTVLSSSGENPRYSIKVDMTKFFQDTKRKTNTYPRFFHFKMKLQCEPKPGLPVTIAKQVMTEKQTLKAGDDPESFILHPKICQDVMENAIHTGFNTQSLGQVVSPIPQMRIAGDQFRAAEGNAVISYNQVTSLLPVREAIDFSQPITVISKRTTIQNEKNRNVDEFHVKFNFQQNDDETSTNFDSDVYVKLSLLSDSFVFAYSQVKCTIGGSNGTIYRHYYNVLDQTANDITTFFPVRSHTNWGNLFDLHYENPRSIDGGGVASALYFMVQKSAGFPTTFDLQCEGIYAQSKWVSQNANNSTFTSNQDEVLLVSVFYPTNPPPEGSTAYHVPDIRRSQLNYNPTHRTIPIAVVTDKKVDVLLIFTVVLLSLPILLIIAIAVLFWCQMRQFCCFTPSYFRPKKKAQLLSSEND